MTFWSLYRRYVRRRFRSYLGYTLTSAGLTLLMLSGLAFFSLLQAPLAEQTGLSTYLRDSATFMLQVVTVLLLSSSYILLIYFHRLFLQEHTRFLGLLNTFGLSRRKRFSLILGESFLLGWIGYFAGTVLTLFLGPLILLALQAWFKIRVGFVFTLPITLWLKAFITFSALLLSEGLTVATLFTRRWPKIMFQAVSIPEKGFRPGLWLGLIAIVPLILGYILALTVHPGLLNSSNGSPVAWMIVSVVIIALDIIGTYALNAYGLAAFLRHFRIHSGLTLVLRGRVSARLRSMVGMNTIIAIFLSILLVAMVTLSTIKTIVFEQGMLTEPYPLVMNSVFPPVTHEASTFYRQAVQKMTDSLERDGFAPVTATSLRIFAAEIEKVPSDTTEEDSTHKIVDAYLIPRSDFLRWREAYLKTHPGTASAVGELPEQGTGEAIIWMHFYNREEEEFINSVENYGYTIGQSYVVRPNLTNPDIRQRWKTQGGTQGSVSDAENAPATIKLKSVQGSYANLDLRSGYAMSPFSTMIIGDDDFERIADRAPEWVIEKTALSYPHWELSKPTIVRVMDELNKDFKKDIWIGTSGLALYFLEQYQMVSMYELGIGIVALLYLVSVMLIVFLKSRERIEEDRRALYQLHRLGMSWQEIKKIVRREWFGLVLPPLILSILNVVVAARDLLSTLSPTNTMTALNEVMPIASIIWKNMFIWTLAVTALVLFIFTIGEVLREKMLGLDEQRR
ncbi:MAG: ABC transporter permease protein [Candidatus Carbobacillus altaicus]|uniref:ABC transporter permease protein n=1 Tax=Candidatus Carbonibacillus altaicus TaxID=2163959 RepID=A0A2R6Y3N2_9BACL|nr:MAG: ABC transporter permease protein [Candidatus Carbobacillus altaicus]